MPKLEFLNQFQAIGYSMAKKAKAEVQDITQLKKKKINEINSTFVQTLMRDLKNKTEIFLRNYETQLNQQISENIKDLNLKMLTKKNELFDDYIKSLTQEIGLHIKNNYDSYIQNLLKKINEELKLFNSTVYIQLNTRDTKVFEKIQTEIGSKKLLLDPKTLDCTGGYKLSNRARTVIVSDTIEDLIQKHIIQLRIIFSKNFPEYSDRRKSATELMKERNITTVSSIPEELEDYMIKYDIELQE